MAIYIMTLKIMQNMPFATAEEITTEFSAFYSNFDWNTPIDVLQNGQSPNPSPIQVKSVTIPVRNVTARITEEIKKSFLKALDEAIKAVQEGRWDDLLPTNKKKKLSKSDEGPKKPRKATFVILPLSTPIQLNNLLKLLEDNENYNEAVRKPLNLK